MKTEADFYDLGFALHQETVAKAQQRLKPLFLDMLELCTHALRNGGKLLFLGNGGSAADAQHLATELTVRFSANRPALAALALTTDTSALTAIGNDLGFEKVFARQIEALGKETDIVIAISTSGKSANILRALEQARKQNIRCCALSGKNGGELHGLANPLLIVPSDITAHIQEVHIILGQMLCAALERNLGLVLPPADSL